MKLRMSTAGKLWLGFGTLTAVLVLSSLATISQVLSVDEQVSAMARARDLSAATSQLDADVQGYSLGIRTYLQNGDPRPLQEAMAAAAAVERDLMSYRTLATTERQLGMADQFEPLWQELHTLGEALVAPEDRLLRLDHSKRLYELRRTLEDLLDEEMQVDAVQTYNARSAAATRGVRTVVAFMLVLLVAGAALAVLTSTAVGRGVVRSEAALWASREQFRITLASLSEGVITTDTEGRVSYLNPVAEVLTGWNLGQAGRERLESVFHVVHPHTRDKVANPAERALREGVSVRLGPTHATVLISRDGSERPVDTSAAPIRDEQGNVAGAVLIFRDITERYRMESELRRNAAELSEADRRKNEFLAILAHELRNPLAPIGNAVEIMRLSGEDPRPMAAARAMVERQLGQLVRLVDDLLDVSRISRGKIELRKTRLEIGPIVQQSVESVTPLLGSLQHRLELDLPTQPVWVMADPARLAQVLGNLLNNACKFTDAGGMLRLGVREEDGQVVIRVRDNGIGIAPEQLPQVFDLFVQADTSLERQGSGLGIGLTLVKELVQLHGGSVSVHSAGLGQGSEFTVRLPRLAVESDAVDPDSTTLQAPATPPIARRILVVDDNRDSADSMAMLLQLDGHLTQVAWDGLDALTVAESWRPEVILLDIGLPGLNGFEVARRIREQPWSADTLLVAVTGWGQEADRARSREAGFDTHLVKPASHASIVKLLADPRRPREAAAPP